MENVDIQYKKRIKWLKKLQQNNAKEKTLLMFISVDVHKHLETYSSYNYINRRAP